MNDKLQDALAELAKKLGTTAEHLWPVLVKQVQMEAVFNFWLWLSSIIIFSIFSIVFCRKANKDGYNSGWDIVAGIFVCALIIDLALGGTHVVPHFFLVPKNPEFYALKELRHLF
jgi:hypothetical protein